VYSVYFPHPQILSLKRDVASLNKQLAEEKLRARNLEAELKKAGTQVGAGFSAAERRELETLRKELEETREKLKSERESMKTVRGILGESLSLLCSDLSYLTVLLILKDFGY